jgi:hypothetical protein
VDVHPTVTAVQAISNIVKSSLGPVGLDKARPFERPEAIATDQTSSD